MFLTKIDAKLTEKNHISGVFEKSSTSSLASGANLPAPYGSNRISSNIEYMAQLNDTHILSANLVNIFGAGFTMNSGISLNPTQGSGWAAKAGLTNVPTGAVSTEFPMVSFSGGTAPPTSWENGNPSFAETPYSEVLQDNLQWIKGKHSFTFGGQVILQAEELNQPSFWSNNGQGFSNSETGQFVQTGTNAGSLDPSTGNPYASFLLGLVDNAGLAINSVAETGGRWRNYAAYVQDDWKITPKLTVNMGLRYIIPKPFVEVHDRAAWFDPTNPNPVADNASGTVQFAGYGIDACNCHTNVKTHYLTFGPRFGFAYSLNSTTVIRSSFAITHFNGAALGGNGQQQGVGIQGFSNNPSFSSSDNGVTPAFKLDSGIPSYVQPPFFNAGFATGYTTTAGATGDQGGYSYDRPATAGRSPYTEGWSLTLEKELPSAFVVNLTYAGSSSHFAGLNGGVGIYSNQVSPGVFQTPGVGALLGQTANAANLAKLQALLPGITLPYANFSGNIGQMLRPFPQYDASGATWAANPDPWSDFGTQNYNALQATVTHNMRSGLYLLASYALSKEEDEGGDGIQFFGANARSAYDWKREKSIGFMDSPQSFSFTELYKLPIGSGKLVNVQNHIANTIVGGWELAGIEQYSAGTPLSPVAGACTANAYGGHRSIFGNGGSGCYDDYNSAFTGNVKLAKIGSGQPGPSGTAYFNVNAFVDPNTTAQLTPYSLGNTPRTLPFSSMRNEFYRNENLSLSKTFPIFERLRFQFKVDALNVFNRAIFGGVDMNAQSPTSFGKATNQSNTARQLQMEGYIRF